MRRLFIVLGIIAAVFSLILSVTFLFQVAYIPAVVAMLFGLIAFYMSKQKQYPKKTIQLIFLLTSIAVVLTSYKLIFDTAKDGDKEDVELREETPMYDSKPTLEDLKHDEPDILRGE